MHANEIVYCNNFRVTNTMTNKFLRKYVSTGNYGTPVPSTDTKSKSKCLFKQIEIWNIKHLEELEGKKTPFSET